MGRGKERKIEKSEVVIYNRKVLREKVRKHAFDQEKNKIQEEKKTR